MTAARTARRATATNSIDEPHTLQRWRVGARAETEPSSKWIEASTIGDDDDMATRSRLLIAGKLVVDEVLTCAHIPLPGSAQRAVSRAICGGGQVWHTAQAALAGGIDVTVTGWCGADSDSTALRERLVEVGVADSMVAAGRGSRAIVLVGPDGERTIVSHSGDGFVDALPVHVLDEADWLHLDGHALDEVSGSALTGLARRAAVQGIPLSLEPPSTVRIAARMAWWAGLPHLAAAFGRPDEVELLLPYLATAPDIIVRHDQAAPVIVNRAGRHWQVPVPIADVVALGAGDRFAGGWLAANLQGADPVGAATAGIEAALAPAGDQDR